MSTFFLRSALDIPPISSIPDSSDKSCMKKINDPAHFFSPTLPGYFWDVEEIRHQEHLHRVSHAQYLYRHRHDSNEAARMYRIFMDEQNQWMDEQEQMKEMESRLSMRAYQQRASRWEEEWRRLQEGRKVEDILKLQKTGAVMLTAPIQRGLRDYSFGRNHENDLSDLAITSRTTISSLHLPEPLLSIPSSYSRLVFSDNDIQQVDGAHPSRNHGHKPTHDASGFLKPGTQSDGNHAPVIVPEASQGGPTTIAQPDPYSDPHQTPHTWRAFGNSYESHFKSPADERPSKRQSLVPDVGAASPTLSSDYSYHNQTQINSSRPQGEYEQDRDSPFTSDEFLQIIGHKSRGNKNFQYMILRKPRGSGVPTELWVKAIDFAESEKRVILEGYHLHHNLGPVRWPRDPRRQWRSSTSFGVQELKSALDERKQMLLDQGVDESEALRETNQERWKMRDEWQRTGRGWGSAMMIVKGRKKAWSMTDSNTGKHQSTVAASSSDYVGIHNPDTTQLDPELLDISPRVWGKSYRHKSASPPNTPEPSNPKRPEQIGQEVRSQFAFTSEDEREWREIFGPDLIRSSLSKSKTSSGLSRVRSTIHNPRNRPNLELARAVTLPELHERIAKFQTLPKKLQKTIQLPKSRPPISTSPTLSDAQSHLKAQRKNLLTRLLSHGPFKRESRGHAKPVDTSSSNNDIVEQSQDGSQIIFFQTATVPFGSTDNQHPGNQPSATQESSSYVSFDGASSTVRQSVRKTWTKKLWDKFSHLSVSSRRNSSSKIEKKPRANPQISTYTESPQAREIQPKTVTVTSKATKAGSASALKKVVISDSPPHDKLRQLGKQQTQSQKYQIHSMNLPTPRFAIVETPESRTASWAASVSSGLRKSRTDMETEEATDLNEALFQGSIGVGALSDLSYFRGESWRRSKGKEKAELGSTQSEPLTRTRSQQQYLSDREAERQAHRDKNISRTKAKAKMMKEKADRQVAQLMMLNKLHSKKACLLGKWSKRDQLELELLRMQLGVRGAKNTWKMSDLRRLSLGDLEELRQSLLPTAKVARKQPK